LEKNDLLFVYGTLRRGASNDIEQNFSKGYAAPRVSYVQHDRINGAIYNVGNWFPGASLSSVENKNVFTDKESFIVGDIFCIEDPSVVKALDMYEGYPSLFGRECAVTEGGLTVFLYTYNRGIGADDALISTGDWLNPNPLLISQAE